MNIPGSHGAESPISDGAGGSGTPADLQKDSGAAIRGAEPATARPGTADMAKGASDATTGAATPKPGIATPENLGTPSSTPNTTIPGTAGNPAANTAQTGAKPRPKRSSLLDQLKDAAPRDGGK